jgi:hypothetical protein
MILRRGHRRGNGLVPEPLELSLVDRLELLRIQHDLATIQAIPQRVLHGLPRMALVALCHRGECYAYAAFGSGGEAYNLWIQVLADRRGDRDGRIPIEEWIGSWRALYREATRVI